MNKIILPLYSFYKEHPAVTSTGAALLVVLVDFTTGAHVHFPILYVIPVIIAAWQNLNSIAYAISMMLPLARLGFYFPWHQTESIYILTINTLIRIATLIFITYLVFRTASQTRKMKILEGMLPICASCKKIRNEKGEYEQMERYITDHSQASFSHTICPECAKNLYPVLNAGRNK